MKKHGLFLLIWLFLGCNHEKAHSSKITINNHFLDKKQIDKTISRLLASKKFDPAYKYVDTLIYYNKNNGFLYYERGFINTYTFHPEAAIKDYKTAEMLGFDKNKCETMIETARILIDGKPK